MYSNAIAFPCPDLLPPRPPPPPRQCTAINVCFYFIPSTPPAPPPHPRGVPVMSARPQSGRRAIRWRLCRRPPSLSGPFAAPAVWLVAPRQPLHASPQTDWQPEWDELGFRSRSKQRGIFGCPSHTHVAHIELDLLLLSIVGDAFQVCHSAIVTIGLLLTDLLHVLVACDLCHVELNKNCWELFWTLNHGTAVPEQSDLKLESFTALNEFIKIIIVSGTTKSR